MLLWRIQIYQLREKNMADFLCICIYMYTHTYTENLQRHIHVYICVCLYVFFLLCDIISGKYSSVLCTLKISVSLCGTRFNRNIHWFKVIFLFFKLLNTQYFASASECKYRQNNIKTSPKIGSTSMFLLENQGATNST